MTYQDFLKKMEQRAKGKNISSFIALKIFFLAGDIENALISREIEITDVIEDTIFIGRKCLKEMREIGI